MQGTEAFYLDATRGDKITVANLSARIVGSKRSRNINWRYDLQRNNSTCDIYVECWVNWVGTSRMWLPKLFIGG